MSQFKPPRKLQATSLGCRPQGSGGAVLPAPAPQKPHCLLELELIQMKKSLITAALLCAAVGAANAAVTINADQVGADVVFTLDGSINLAGLGSPGYYIMGLGGGLSSGTNFYNELKVGAGSLTDGVMSGFDIYEVSLNSRPSTSFLSVEGTVFSSYGSGDNLLFSDIYEFDYSIIFVQTGYVSGSALHSTSTYAGTTLGGLNLVAGSYTWAWGSGATADSVTLNINAVAPVPEPESYALMLAGLGALGAVSRRQRRAR